jgi:hypothetical protein
MQNLDLACRKKLCAGIQSVGYLNWQMKLLKTEKVVIAHGRSVCKETYNLTAN